MKNNIITGILASVLVTFFGTAMVYVLKYMPLNFSYAEFWADLVNDNLKQSAILSLSLLANIPLIYFNQTRKLYKTITGIAIVIGILCVLIINAKFNIT